MTKYLVIFNHRGASPVNLIREFIDRLQLMVDITPESDEVSLPPDLKSFYLFFIRQTWRPLAAILVLGTITAVIDTMIPAAIAYFIRTSLNGSNQLSSYTVPIIVFFVAFHPAVSTLHRLFTNHAISANLPTLVRWQSHTHIARQPISFFHSDLSGRLASRVLQTGPALRDTIVTATTSVWYIVVFAGSSLFMLANADLVLAVPVTIWILIYTSLLACFLPRLKQQSREMSKMRSSVTARLVDTYANIQTIKLYSGAGAENDFIREGLREHNQTYQALLTQNSIFSSLLAFLNGGLIGSTLGLSLWLAGKGEVEPSQFALIIPLVWHIASASVNVTQQLSSIFENIGVVQEGIRSIARPIPPENKNTQTPLDLTDTSIKFDRVSFRYPSSDSQVEDITFVVPEGRRLAIVGPSGAGKSTIINLLLRLHKADSGSITIGDRSITDITNGSLRSTMAVVSQETAILSRSVLDNIRFGKPGASLAAVQNAASLAGACEFIEELRDTQGRCGYNAHIGERGVKLSGGQRQRLALARALLKDAPILILDEATSSLDVLSEAGLRKKLENHLQGKSVIAIAHRIETIVGYDEILVLKDGRIVERGAHADLLAHQGTYHAMWIEQSGRGAGSGLIVSAESRM